MQWTSCEESQPDYANETGETREATLTRAARERESKSFGSPVFLEFEEQRLGDGIGYVRFNTRS